jgi:excisionase family DNA binding protein
MRLLTVQQVIERLHLSRSSVYELISSGEIPSLKIGRARRVSEDDLDRFIAERIAGSGDAA